MNKESLLSWFVLSEDLVVLGKISTFNNVQNDNQGCEKEWSKLQNGDGFKNCITLLIIRNRLQDNMR